MTRKNCGLKILQTAITYYFFNIFIINFSLHLENVPKPPNTPYKWGIVILTPLGSMEMKKKLVKESEKPLKKVN